MISAALDVQWNKIEPDSVRRIIGEQVGRDLFSDIAVEALNMMTGQTLYQRINSSIENTVDGLWPIQQLPK